MSQLTDKQIMEFFQNKVNECEIIIEDCEKKLVESKKELTYYKNLLQPMLQKHGLIIPPIYKSNPPLYFNESTKIPTQFQEVLNRVTFKSVIVKILKEEGRPMLSRELYTKYISSTGKEISLNTFSGQLSTAVSSGRSIVKIEILNNPMETRNYYAVIEWCDENGKLKSEYSDMLPF